MRIFEGIILLGFGVLILMGGLFLTFSIVVYSLKEQDNEGFWYLILSVLMILLGGTSLLSGWTKINNRRID
jgi:cytochrome bd-type quinol oxidase subunit 1